MNDKQVAHGLGWFSVGLGLAELLCPRKVAHSIGVNGNSRLIQALGAREIVGGLGILSGKKQAGWLWSRVAGDFIDIALLGISLGGRSSRTRLAAATAAVLGVTAVDVFCTARQTGRRSHWLPQRKPGQK